MTLKEVLNVFEKDYPEVCLYELGEGKGYFGGEDGMDQLEVHATNLVIFCCDRRGKPCDKIFSFVNKSEEELKEFLKKYF
jgi:hypothetical protein